MLPNHLQNDVVSFLLQRKKAYGGYGATPKLPATVQDTYHALSIIGSLGLQDELNPVGDPLLHEYLATASLMDRQGARITFQMLAACRLASVRVDRRRCLSFIDRRLSDTDDLEERYYCCRIEREILGGAGEKFRALSGPSANWIYRAASELFMLLYLAQEAGERQSELSAWLRQCQGFDGGFGFLPGTTSFVENCYDCLRAFFLLNAAPKDPSGCRDYILACGTTSGGFARKNGAAAFLSSTWHAVAALALLQKVRQ